MKKIIINEEGIAYNFYSFDNIKDSIDSLNDIVYL